MRLYEDSMELAEAIIGSMMELDCDYAGSVTLVADSDTCADVLKDLLFISAMEDYEFDIMSVIVDRDEPGPYMLSLTTDGEIWAQRGTTDDGGRIMLDDEVVYIMPEYVKDYKDTIADCEAEMVVFDYGNEEDKLGFISNDEGRICGFHYDDDGDGYCCHVMYCACQPKVDEITEMCNKIIEIIARNR